MVQHQKHCQAYQVLLPNDVPSSSISSLAPSTPPTGLGLDFGVKSFECLPFGSFSFATIHAHPFHYLTRGATCFFVFLLIG
jgi:hypothetical protein